MGGTTVFALAEKDRLNNAMISALILTHNEERDLLGCLETLSWCDDVNVFDSCSSDGTVAIAKAGGARVASRVFDGYASQRNAALHGLGFKYEWVLVLDADERLPESTAKQLLCFVSEDSAGFSAARLHRRDYLFGRWLKHSSMSPLNIRLVRPPRVRLQREINEVLEVDGRIANLNCHFDHFPFSKGISHWINKHNRYSTMEAKRALEERASSTEFSWSRALWDSDFHIRRFHQKGLYYRMPARPLIKWMYLMCWRRAFLDGRAGIAYAALQAFYELMIVLKERELQEQLASSSSGKENKA